MTLDSKHLKHIQSFNKTDQINVRDRQTPCRMRYNVEPKEAWVIDYARTADSQVSANHPIHTHVICGEGVPIDVPVSVHKAVGGESDFPCPGEILSASLASCLDTAIRMIANLKGIKLAQLEVQVSFSADVRGTLMMGDNVPVGFQSANIEVSLKSESDLPETHLNALLDAAERSCVILQTLRSSPKVKIKRNLEGNNISELN